MSEQNPFTETLRGEAWTARRIGGNRFVLSVRSGAEIIAAIADFARSQGIQGGSFQGIGAVRSATLLFRDAVELTYVDRVFDEQMEITALAGNIALKGDELLVHAHATLGRADYTALAGHLKESWVRGAGEVFVTASNVPLHKALDDETQLNIFTL